MTMSGSGIGGPGAPPQLSQRELEATASTDVAKSAMKILSDSLDTSYFVMDKEVCKYLCSSAYPTIAPLMLTRTLNSYSEPNDDAWKPVYQELIGRLPPRFRQQFEDAMKLSPDVRNSNYTVLDGVLKSTASLMASLRSMSAPIEPDSMEAARAVNNVTLPYVALNCLAACSQALIQNGESYLKQVGPNNAAFDKIANALSEYKPLSNDLALATHLLSDASTEAEGKKLLSDLHEQLTAFSTRFDSQSGGDFQLLSQTLHAAILITAALSTSTLGSAALTFGLNNANVALDKTSSPLGINGANFSSFTQAIVDWMTNLIPSTASPGGKELVGKLVENTLLISVLMGTLANDKEKNAQQEKSDVEVKDITERNLAYDLKVTFLTESNLISSVVKSVVNESQVNVDTQHQMSILFEAALLMAIALPSLRGGNLETVTPALNSIAPRLREILPNLKEETRAQMSPEMQVVLQQVDIALKNDDSDALAQAFENGLELTGDVYKFTNDVNNLKTTAHNGADAIKSASTSGDITGFHVAA